MRRILWFSSLIPLAIVGVALFFVAREITSWRPQYLGKGHIPPHMLPPQNSPFSAGEWARFKTRFKIRPGDICDLSSDKKRLFHGVPTWPGNYHIVICDLKTGAVQKNLYFNSGLPTRGWFANHNQWIMLQYSEHPDTAGPWKILDTKTGHKIREYMGQYQQFTPEGQGIVSVDGHKISLYETSSGLLIREISLPIDEKLSTFRFTRDGNSIEVGDQNDNLWQIRIR